MTEGGKENKTKEKSFPGERKKEKKGGNQEA